MTQRDQRIEMQESPMYHQGREARHLGEPYANNPFLTPWFRACWELGWNDEDIDQQPDEPREDE